MLDLKRTDSSDSDFLALVQLLDHTLAVLDGEEHAFYAQYNKVVAIRHVVVAYQAGRPVGCGAIKPLEAAGTVEVKRMYVEVAARGHGIATAVLAELEGWARELGYARCILETGKKQPEAIALYAKSGYRRIPNYGQYLHVENSVCFEKSL